MSRNPITNYHNELVDFPGELGSANLLEYADLSRMGPPPADAWPAWPPATPVTRRPTTSSSSFLFDGGAGLRRRTRTWSDALRR